MNDQHVVYLHLDDIIPNRFQPREIFDEKALKELAVSIKEHGIIQPIIVREINNDKYEIIAGERRYKASALAGMTTIPAIVRNLDDKETAKVALLENLQRKNLNPVEEARTYQKIIELDEMTQEQLAKTMGKSQSAVANKLRLLSLPEEVLEALKKEEISERHARALLNVSNSEEQLNLLNRIKEEKMTVRKLEDEIRDMNMVKEDKIENENDLNNLINPQPVKIDKIETLNQPSTPNNSFLMNPLPSGEEVVNYGEIKDDEDEVEDNEPVSDLLIKPIDLDQMKSNANDIGDITKENNDESSKEGSLDSLLNITPVAQQPEITPAEQALKESENINENTEDYFSAPDLMNVNMPTNNTGDALDNIFKNREDGSSNFDSILGFGAPSAPLNEIKQDEPKVDLMNMNEPIKEQKINTDSLGFALMNEEKQKDLEKYNVKEMVDSIRKLIRDLEMRGAKIDTDEMNFEDEYQILIKISKNNDN